MSATLERHIAVTRLSISERLDPALWRRVQIGEDGDLYTTGTLRVIWSVALEEDGSPWLHVSVSRQAMLPTYRDMTRVKSLFVGDDRDAYSVWPRASEHVNIHPNCLHLWSPLDASRPLPNFTRGTGSI